MLREITNDELVQLVNHELYELGERIERLRSARPLTADELAELLTAGLHGIERKIGRFGEQPQGGLTYCRLSA